MKVLIVDDEEHVREGVELAIDWPSYQVAEILQAEDGVEALEIVRREAPELIICDMSMPRMDGPTFLEKLRAEGWDSKVIVLSGYQEFRYAKATLLAQGVDYLLKPFKIDDLNKAVSKAVGAILESRENRNEELRKNFQVHEANTLLQEQKMATYLQADSVNHEGVRQVLQEVGFPVKDFYLLLFLPRNLTAIVDRSFMGDEALFMFSVRNIIKDVLRPLGRFYFFRSDSFFCVLIEGEAPAGDVEYYKAKLEKSWLSTIKLDTFSGFIRKKYDYINILSGIKEARTEILNANILDGGADADKPSQAVTLIDREILLLEALKKRDKEHMADLIGSFVRELRQLGYLPLKNLQHYTMEVNLLIARVSRQLHQEHQSEMLSPWISDLEEWGKELTHIFWLMIESEGEGLASLQNIYAIQHYISSNIGADISLSSLAERFHFSPQYISKKFKETYGTTVMNYLTGLRMEKAKSLLSHSDKAVLEVSRMLGYEDDNYFGKVFRKFTGESPTQYRKHHKTPRRMGD
ncbi:response regulator [Paenibacillus sp. TH7-28]